MNSLPEDFLRSIHEQIANYSMIPDGTRVAVAFSGGKDSLLLCLALRDLGIPYTAVSIDMGYEQGWGERVRRLAVSNGFDIELLPIRPKTRSTSTTVALEISRRIDVLDQLATPGFAEAVTPCTHCYSVKALALNAFAMKHHISVIAFGHHMTDAAASLLKEALLHIDRRILGHECYTRKNFESLVERLRLESIDYRPGNRSPLVEQIDALVYTREVDTDEPPIQPLLRNSECAIDIIRPMHTVNEHEIRHIATMLGARPEGSGCGHGATKATETPREMVHHRVLDQPGIEPYSRHVRDLVGVGIGQNGRSLVEARARRAAMLGSNYKPTGGYEKL